MAHGGRLKAGVWEPHPSIFKPYTKGDHVGSEKRALLNPARGRLLLGRPKPLPSWLRKYYLPLAHESSSQAYKKARSSSCVPLRPSKNEVIPRAPTWELEPQRTAAWIERWTVLVQSLREQKSSH